MTSIWNKVHQSMGENTIIHMDIVRESGEERVRGPMGIDVNTA